MHSLLDSVSNSVASFTASRFNDLASFQSNKLTKLNYLSENEQTFGLSFLNKYKIKRNLPFLISDNCFSSLR